MKTRKFAALSILLTGTVASAQNAFLTPGNNTTLDGIPPIPTAVAEDANRYMQYRTASFAAWHPERLEMLIRTRFADSAQVHRVTQPLGAREQLTFFDEPVAGVAAYDKDADGNEFFAYVRDVGGDEFFQNYRFDVGTGRSTLLTDGEKRNGSGPYSETTGLLAYPRIDADAEGAFTQIRTVDPRDPGSDRLVTTLRGAWNPTDFSPDGDALLLVEYISINDSRIWLLDLETGATRRLLPAEGAELVAHSGALFSADGRGMYLSSDASSEFRKLTYVDLDTLESKVLTDRIDWDVEGAELSKDGKQIAYSVNEAGASTLYLLDTAGGESRRIAGVPAGLISGLAWHNDNRHLGFSLTSARVPGDVFVLDAATGEIVRWTNSETGGIDTSTFPEATLVEWQSFDGRIITAFLYEPPPRFTGKLPVIVNIHGGPEGQSRPRYLGNLNYFLNELGVAIIYPNVRGSAGFGKTFLLLDNGMKREGTYADIGALLDWIGTQDNLDDERIMIVGGSYGGHMTLATATRYSDKIACSVNLFGISNLRTFLENTQGYRRDLRRAEYGDERDPEIRAWMDRTAPMSMVDQIRKPMLVQQGVNDPRVPMSESDQIVASLKRIGTPTWYLVFDDEGHGFRKKPNTDFSFYTTIMFANECLLN